jgi:hypothetical protein
MTEIYQEAAKILQNAEVEIRKLLVRTTKQGQYESTARLIEIAQELQRLAKALESGQEVVARPVSVRLRPTPGTGARARKGDYPQFFVDGDELVKIGWSKKHGEYRHKAPKRSVLLIAKAIQDKAKSGARVRIEEILPIHDPEADQDLPSYQVYLTLAWLRREKLLEPHGRGEYKLAPDGKLVEAIEERWNQLPKL